jgi:ribosomal protein S18 acetylase RimI-like enzyme
MDAVVPELTIRQHDVHGLREQRQDILSVYSEANAERLGDPFYSLSRYWERLAAHASCDGFGFVTGRLGAELVGYALGYPLPAGSGWWRGIRGEVDEALLAETGQRIFAFTELMVRPRWRRRGYATGLHDALLRHRPEERATLLVRPDNTAAHLAYRSWGWTKIGELQPFDDAPIFDAMVRELHV